MKTSVQRQSFGLSRTKCCDHEQIKVPKVFKINYGQHVIAWKIRKTIRKSLEMNFIFIVCNYSDSATIYLFLANF